MNRFSGRAAGVALGWAAFGGGALASCSSGNHAGTSSGAATAAATGGQGGHSGSATAASTGSSASTAGSTAASASGTSGQGGNSGATTSASTGSGTSATGAGGHGGGMPACGAALAACCPGSVCDPGLACDAGVCTQVPVGEIGKVCSKNSDCMSGICLPIGGGQNACTASCANPGDCVAGWNCAALIGQPSNVCQCTVQTETCNGLDDDCNGIVDDEPAVDQGCDVCAAGVQTAGATCKAGTCSGTKTACTPYQCGATACDTSCSTSTQCVAGAFCWAAGCVKATAVTAGDSFSCALTSAGGVQCWGRDADGELGDNGMAGFEGGYPVPVTGLASGVTAIAAAGTHACALTAAGGVQCWGPNVYGEIGNGGMGATNVPVPVMGLASGVAAIAAGSSDTCALMIGGGVQCWGQLLMTASQVPVPVPGLSSGVQAVALSKAGDHACALMTGGGVQCWGWNMYGQLGNGSTTDSAVPVPVMGLSSGVAAIAASGFHTCALTTAGGVLCWGRNDVGQLGNNSTTESHVPVPVTGLASGVKAIAAGGVFTCALTTGGGVQCWGWDDYGELGDDTTTNSPVPVPVMGLSSGVSAIGTGLTHVCAVTSTTVGLQCWGYQGNGDLGNGTGQDSHVPVDVHEP